MQKSLIASFILLLVFHSAMAQQKLTERDMVMLKAFMSGSFSSETQAKADSDYYDIRLHMVPIWKERQDGFWLYVEQAVATAQEKPYRQRVYHVQLQNDSTITSSVYELENPLRFAGAWKKDQPLETLNPDSIKSREGCTIYLKRTPQGTFTGSTPGKDCISNLRGAAYATSEVIIQRDMLLSWDRGWDKNDKQVWGAEKGGYRFEKIR